MNRYPITIAIIVATVLVLTVSAVIATFPYPSVAMACALVAGALWGLTERLLDV